MFNSTSKESFHLLLILLQKLFQTITHLIKTMYLVQKQIKTYLHVQQNLCFLQGIQYS